jgi:protein-S-isoprenylcysteine O-methyltransferase Ste14
MPASSRWDDPWAGGAVWVAAQTVLLLAIVVAEFYFDEWPWDPGLAVEIAGIALGLAGLAFLVAGFVALGDALTPLPRPRAPVQIVESGPYALVRHPIYGGVILLMAGSSLWRGSLVGLVLTAVLALLFHHKGRLEEDWLERLAPEYGSYRRRVRHSLIPYVY